MDEFKVDRFSESEEILKKIELGEYDGVLNIDFDAIKNNLEKGIITDSEREFIKIESQLDYFKALSLYYYIKDICALDNERGEKLLQNKKILKIIDFYVNNTELFKRIKERINVLETIKTKPEKSEELKKTIVLEDNAMGIIVANDSSIGSVDDSPKKTYHAGTKKELTLSNLIGKPFLGESYRPEQTYGVYVLGHERKLSFIPIESVTLENKQKIQKRETKLKLLKIKLRLNPSKFDKIGYVGSGEYYTLISETELIEAGIIPSEVDWKPLAIGKTSFLTTFDISETTRFEKSKDISVMEQRMAQYEISLRKDGNSEYKYRH